MSNFTNKSLTNESNLTLYVNQNLSDYNKDNYIYFWLVTNFIFYIHFLVHVSRKIRKLFNNKKLNNKKLNNKNEDEKNVIVDNNNVVNEIKEISDNINNIINVVNDTNIVSIQNINNENNI